MKEFEVEYDRKTVRLKFYDPTQAEETKWMRYLSEKDEKRKEVAEGKMEPKMALDLISEVTKEKNKMLLGLFASGAEIKTPEDFEKLSTVCRKAIYEWFDESIGITTSKEKENFTKS